MALLTRMVGAPLAIDIGPGAVAGLAPLLADRRISRGGRVAVAVGPGQGEEIAEVLRPQLTSAHIWMVEGGSVDSATELRARLRRGFFDAVVGIGGGKTLDTAKHAAALSGLPMVSVATSLAHDGIASPVSSLYDGERLTSFGVQMPIAVVVDLDYVRASDVTLRRSGIGDVLSNLGAIADWRLAARERGEPLDGLAVTFARSAATAILHREDGVEDDDFLIALAEALVLSGLAMATAGSSRPCSGGDHEIVHAIDHLYPATAHHGELAGVGGLFTSWLRGDDKLTRDLDACLTRHGLPRTPADLGLEARQFAQAVYYAPATRPDRYTILEHLGLSEVELGDRVRAYAEAFDRPRTAESQG
ncbi:MAG TPA: iron-containing alcohol dehydrogenase family protein [Thermoleophilaceae bacterium]